MLTTSLFRRFSTIVPLAALVILLFSTTGKSGTYLDSGHGGSNIGGQGVERLDLVGSYSPGNCAHCHEQHASIDGSEPAPVKPGPSDHLLFDDLANNNLCNYCHGSTPSNGADNIASQIAKPHSHDPNSVIGSVLCGDCHNSHIAQTDTHREPVPTVGNAIEGPLLSVSGVSATWNLPLTPSPGFENLDPNPTLNSIATITMEYQLCLKCHGGQIGGLENIARQFNDRNYSVHPVTTSTWNNAHLRGDLTALNPPWNGAIDTQMYCSDCHGSENSGDPTGPHGSNNTSMLTDVVSPSTNYDALCTRCHAVTTSSNWDSASNGYPAGRDHNFGPHTTPINSLGCLACHGGIGGPLESSIHGANYVWPDEGGNPGRPSTAFLVGGLITKNYDSGGNRWCSSSCHTLDLGAGYRY